MIVSIMQPAYLPWLGYFDRILKSDLHIILDHVPIDRNSKTKFANRNKIRTAEGWNWLTVPIRTKGQQDALGIDRLQIVHDADWPSRHWRAIEYNYRRAAYFSTYAEPLHDAIAREEPMLSPLLLRTTQLLLDALEIDVPVKRSSLMGITSHKQNLILDLCRAVGATKYISGPFGRQYLDIGSFQSSGIELLFHDYVHPQYAQAYPGFVSHLSALDLLLNHGKDSRAILHAAGSSVH